MGSPRGDGPIGVSRSAIAYGTLDTTHTAVVAVLAPVGTTQLQECSGTIVYVRGEYGYVLTAAHCCNTYVPTVVVIASDYTDGDPGAYLSGGTPAPPVYRVVPGSVSYDPMYNGNASPPDHDFCMLQFSGATSSTPTIALPTSTNDGLQVGSQIEHVGFGVTQTGANSKRMMGTDVVDALSPLTLQFNQGGDADIPGTCEGDSGGPSLLPASASQAQQVVVAVQSYGNNTTCSADTLGGASRVSSAIGPVGFITSYLPAPTTPVPAAGPLELAVLTAWLFVIGVRRVPLV